MPKIIKNTLAGGELSTDLDGRTDLAKYATGVQLMSNFYPTRFGGASNRPGMEFVGKTFVPALSTGRTIRLVPFQFSVTQTYVLEFTSTNFAGFLRVIKDGAIVLTDIDAATWTQSTGNPNEYYITTSIVNEDNPIVELWENGTQIRAQGTVGSLAVGEYGYGYNEAGPPLSVGYLYFRASDDGDLTLKADGYVKHDYRASTSILASQLPTVSFAQSKDVLFVAHEGLPPAKITRTADDAWTYAALTFAPSATAPTDFYTSKTGFTANDKPQFYKIANLDEDLNESIATDEIRVDTDLNWPAAGRVDLYWNNINDGLESTPVFQWTQSASGTNEYYCELNGGGDPSLPTDISTMWENKDEMTEGVLGSLAIGEWAYGDNDTLGFDTVYVRIAAGADPDTKAVGYLLYKRTSDNQYRVYKNLRGDWGWLADLDVPWFLDDSDIEPDIAVAPKVDDDPFNTGTGLDYPSCVAIFQQRLVYGRSRNNPQRVWMSTSGDLTNFSKSQPLSSEDPIKVTLVSGGRVDEIRHFLPLRQDLLTLTSGSEYTLSAAESGGAIGPFNIQFKKQGYEGVSQTIPPIGIANKGVFVERNNRDIRQIEYVDESSGYPSQDLNLLTKHLFENKTIVDWCYQQSPHSIVWMVMSDGTMVSMTYLPEQDLIAFARHSTDGFVKACESITTDGDDEVYFIVARTATTATASQNWYVEKLASREFGSNVRDAKFLDSMLSYNPELTITNVAITATEITVTSASHGYSNGDFVLIDDVVGISATGSNSEYTQFNDRYYKVANVATNTFELADLDGTALTSTDFSGTYLSGGSCWKCTNTVSGLNHLEGDTVTVLADGSAIGTFTVSSGSITLGTSNPGYGVVHVGLPYNCDIQTLRLDIPSNVETMQYVKKNIRKLIMRFKDSVGGYAGPDSDNLTLIKWRQYEEWLQPNVLKTEDVEHKMKSTWDKDGRIYFRQSDPYPTTILAFIMEVDVGDL